MNNLSDTQTIALQMFWQIVQAQHGLPDEDFVPSRLDALELIRQFDPVREASVDEAMSIMSSNPKGALTLLCVTLLEANRKGLQVSLPDIRDAKNELTRSATIRVSELAWFFREALKENG